MAFNQDLDQVHKAITSDPSLRSRLEGIRSPDDYARLATEVGKARGFNFTEQDVTNQLRQASAQSGGTERELNRQQLESVAGGALCSLEQWWYDRFTSGKVKCS